MALVGKPIEYWCKTCDAGPFTKTAKGSCGETIWSNHHNAGHHITVYKEPEKSLEAIATAVALDHWDEWLHEVIADMKGQYKVSLLRNKSLELIN